MNYLLDTNVLVRLSNVLDPDFTTAVDAVATLYQRQDTLFTVSQNITEFWAVATRPHSANGLSLSIPEAEQQVQMYEINFPTLPDLQNVHHIWRNIARSLGIIGKQVHDARLAAAAIAHGLDAILTFNVAHFTRFTGMFPNFQIIHPADVASANP